MLKKFVRIFGGDPNKRIIERYTAVVTKINALEAEFERLSDEALRAKTAEFRAQLAEQTEGLTDEKELNKAQQDALDELLPQAFAAVREASKRTIGLRHYDVQFIGGMALHQNQIAEMRTGEGKTLVATLPLYLNALTGRGVHLITVNDYLARRDARWMAPIYNALGLSVGVLQMAARTENGQKAFLVDLSKESPHEDQHQLRMVARADAYAADITYGTNSEFGFDYLRDNMTYRLDERVQRGHYFAIVDEVDNVLIDEARTPLIISGPAAESADWYVRMAQLVRQLRPEDYEISETDRTVTLSEIGEVHVEELLGQPLRDPERPEDISPEQARLMGYLEQALRAQFLFKRNKDYLVQAGKVIIVDEFTGRLMPGRRWSDGLHQAVEAKEGCKVEAENATYATITIQNYFRMYAKLAGMSGTALTEAEEFDKIYKLGVVAVPTNLEYQAVRPESGLVEQEGRDEQGYKYHFYARKDDAGRKPLYWRRKDYPDIVFRTEEAKFRAIVTEIMRYHAQGRPLLVGTTSVELSERLSGRLRAEPLRRLAQVLLLRHAWLDQNQREEDGRLISELKFLNEPLDKLEIADLRKMGRDLGITLNPEDPSNLERLLTILELQPAQRERLATLLQGGIPHEVLNARKHTEESQIIAGAGGFGALTIATNMAGRGVDIKLGGELAEEHLAIINRVLRKAGHADPYDMSMAERRQALLALSPAEYGIYDTEVKFFLQFLDEMEQVKALGGLHIIGSERHEARRIDNQLRGRAARQGDPGSSRFYLSLEDELMRRFGGEQANNLMQRFQIDDAVPMEYGIVSRIVESSQTRVEGANFDTRKHLLEYDDVLNAQRAAIYAQRDRIFTKEDLTDDVNEMLTAEVERRVAEAFETNEKAARGRKPAENSPSGPWKLLAWLEQIQPTRQYGSEILSSYPLQLILDEVMGQLPHSDDDSGEEGNQSIPVAPGQVTAALVNVADMALQAENEHLLQSAAALLEQYADRLDEQIKERQEALDTFFEGVRDEEAETLRPPRQLGDDLSAMVRISLRLTPDQQRALRDDPRRMKNELRPMVEEALTEQAVRRALGAIERRVEEPLGLNPADLSQNDWGEVYNQVIGALESLLEKRRQRLVGEGGQIRRDMEVGMAKLQGRLTPLGLAYLLGVMTEGARAEFDKRTHRRVLRRTTRLTYIYYAAQLLEKSNPADVTEEVLKHFERVHDTMQRLWGLNEWGRVAPSSPATLDQPTQQILRFALGEEIYQQVQNLPLQSLSKEQTLLAINELGRRPLTEFYRHLLLGVITDLWVDYLTEMEGLRVSIGLEAYAQRDPLVQYKSRAFQMFETLIQNTRSHVVGRMFAYRIVSVSPAGTNTEQTAGEAEPAEKDTLPAEGNAPAGPAPELSESVATETSSIEDSASKRKRHRRR